MKAFTILIVLTILTPAPPTWAAEPDIASHPKGIWSIAGTDKAERWVVIHNLEQGNATGVYHIEVLQKPANAPAWQTLRLASHLAITTEALKRSVIRPLGKGAVYPESFNDALTKWKAQNNGRGGPVCTTSIKECVRK